MVAAKKASLYRRHTVTLPAPLSFFFLTPGVPRLLIGMGPSYIWPQFLPFRGAAEDGWTDRHTESSLPTLCALLPGSVTTIGALSGSSAIFPIGLENLQNLSKMSKDNERCFVNMVNGTWLVSCGSCYRRLNLQNGSLVLRSVEKEDEGNYEFVFNDITKSFALEVLGKWLC